LFRIPDRVVRVTQLADRGREKRAADPKKRAGVVIRRLTKAYPQARIALEYSTPLDCVVATILSAQSTDVGVNRVTRSLFQKYRRPEDYLAVSEEELQQDIHATGFFRQKTKSLKGMAELLLSEFDGEVPRRIADLIRLPGVARKTANIVQVNCYPEEAAKDPDAGIAVDTHVGRVSVRLNLTSAGPKDAVKIEKDLVAVMPKKRRTEVSDLFIEHGRLTCDARKPRCGDCPVEDLCPSSQVAGLPDLYRARMSKNAGSDKPPAASASSKKGSRRRPAR
jgi:endonuclease III